MTADYVEYVAIYHDKDLNKYTETWDIPLEMPESQTIDFLEDQADKNSMELVWLAKASKTIFHDEDTDTFNTVYNTGFKEVDIYVHPPRRFRDIANAE
jgi:hypothetical protein